MRVYFKEDFEPYGRRGEIKDVSDGLARNLLIRKGIAIPATESIIKHVRTVEEQKKEKSERLKKIAEKEAEELNGKTFEFAEVSKEDGELYGSIRKENIEEKIRKRFNFKSDFEVLIDEPIKKTGRYEVEVLFMKQYKAKIKIVVKPKVEK